MSSQVKLLTQYQKQKQSATQKTSFDAFQTLDIVNHLGGLDAVIEHCLKDDKYCQDNIKTENIEELAQLILKQSANDIDNQTAAVVNNNYITNVSLSKPTIAKHVNCKVSIIGSIVPFHTHKTIFVVDTKRCCYFQYLPPEIASFIYFNVILNKWFIISMSVILFIWGSINMYIGYFTTTSVPIVSTILMNLFVSILCLLYGLGVNFDIFWLIIETFDFWFKSYNLIIWIICSAAGFEYFDEGDELGLRTWRTIYAVSLVILSFMMDGLLISRQSKIIFSIILSLWILHHGIMVFFVANENNSNLNWNPLRKWSYSIGRYTNVNFKSAYISAVVNITIFTMKPVIAVIIQKFKSIGKCSGTSESNVINGNMIQNDVQRASVVYRKPYFEWINWDKSQSKLKEASHKSRHDVIKP